jgi:hypothetical protein
MEDIWFLIWKLFIDVDGPFYVLKLVENHHMKKIWLHH